MVIDPTKTFLDRLRVFSMVIEPTNTVYFGLKFDSNFGASKACVFVTWVFVFERSKNFVLVYTTYHVCLQASWRSYLLAGENGKVIPDFKKILQWQTWGGGDFWFWYSLKRGLHGVNVGASNNAFMWLECLALRGA